MLTARPAIKIFKHYYLVLLLFIFAFFVSGAKADQPNLGEECTEENPCQTGICILQADNVYRCGIAPLPNTETPSPFPSELPQPNEGGDCSYVACSPGLTCDPHSHLCVQSTPVSPSQPNNTSDYSPPPAANNPAPKKPNGEIIFTPQVIGDIFPEQKIEGDTLAKFIRAVYKYMIGIVGIIAAIVMMYGGLLWLTAGGESGRVSEAQSWIKASLTGLILSLSSFLILSTINPDLVNLKSLKITPVDNINLKLDEVSLARKNGGCCKTTETHTQSNANIIYCKWVSEKSMCERTNISIRATQGSAYLTDEFMQGQSCVDIPVCEQSRVDKTQCTKNGERDEACPDGKDFCINNICSYGLNHTNMSDCTIVTGGRVDGNSCKTLGSNIPGYCKNEQCLPKQNLGAECEHSYECINSNCYTDQRHATYNRECYDDRPVCRITKNNGLTTCQTGTKYGCTAEGDISCISGDCSGVFDCSH